jgi:hypothetical protein
VLSPAWPARRPVLKAAIGCASRGGIGPGLLQGQGQTPESGQTVRSGTAVPSVMGGGTGPRHGAGPAEAPLAQANQAPPEIDYRTESVMTTQTTSACSQCKGPLSRSSCGIARPRYVRQAVQASRAYP